MRDDHLAATVIFFPATTTTEIYTLSLHDALPISAFPVSPPRQRRRQRLRACRCAGAGVRGARHLVAARRIDRKSTRLNSSHMSISYAVFCLKKKRNAQMLLLRDTVDRRTRAQRVR